MWAAVVLHSSAALSTENCTRAAAARAARDPAVQVQPALSAAELDRAKATLTELGLKQTS